MNGWHNSPAEHIQKAHRAPIKRFLGPIAPSSINVNCHFEVNLAKNFQLTLFNWRFCDFTCKFNCHLNLIDDGATEFI